VIFPLNNFFCLIYHLSFTAAMLLKPLLVSLALVAISKSLDISRQDARRDYTTSDSFTADVIILGAGIAGISTARALIKEYNVTDVLLIEARGDIGGRAHTEHLVNPNTGHKTTVEKGCNWVQGFGHENITKLAKKWGLKTQAQDYDSAAWFEGTRGTDPKDASTPPGRFLSDDELTFGDDYDNVADHMEGYIDYRQGKKQVDITARAGLSILDWLPKTPLQKLYEWYSVDFTFAQTPEVCSLYNTFSVSEEADQDRLVIDQRGYRYIFEQELKEAFGGTLDDKRLHLNTLVENIDYSGASPVVTTDKGTFTARKHVVVTFSIGVLQDNRVTWTPRMPDWKKEAIYSFAMALYQKIFLLFDRQFWRNEQFQLYADPDVRGRDPLWQNLNAPGFFNGSKEGYVYFVTNVDEQARRLGYMSDKDIKDELMFKLKEMYGNDIPEPLDIVVPRWDHDPLYRGSYSNWPLGELDQHHSNLRQPIGNNTVFFTGEAYSKELFGYVQGAWEDGKDTAATIASCIKGSGCPEAFAYEDIQICPQTSTVLKRSEIIRKRNKSGSKAK
jgi:polyamine oxidase